LRRIDGGIRRIDIRYSLLIVRLREGRFRGGENGLALVNSGFERSGVDFGEEFGC
jgi:hypothetical protein